MLAIVMLTVAAACSGKKDDCPWEISDRGVVIDGITWATRNVSVAGRFVSRPENAGRTFTFDQAQTACPEGWRPPTKEELKSLSEAESAKITVNGINGRLFGGGSGCIFLPNSGEGKYYGTYWSGDTHVYENETFGIALTFDDHSSEVFANVITYKNSDFSVRCVKK